MSQKPFQATTFVPSARAFRTLYVYLPGFSNNHVAIYDILYHYWNASEGYAWPPHALLQKESGLSDPTVISCLKFLEKYGLIRVLTNPSGQNKTYDLFAPIEDEAFFWARFPEALENKRKRDAAIDARAARPNRAQRRARAAKESAMPVAAGMEDLSQYL
ncbi:hypothetical protein BSK49_03770 [Paenibacillus odorifer]|uniref:helix-turn-helix domain-containing protein n=1 Tax=Paenibacillus odorifer TaxID=189426 RepID=UPI00096F106C|nr:helix-turn-helix domain-containing protein [Paenibacillus odorifer]OMD92407.1 hypothetical protein BSK49_03770 [Paenibacillus odorifer]